ncbi:MAG: hybrid sensor histidine kinase/response regulator, partial [Lachnospiraceae bacterium]|nr:hybrid sensor histidine kinase/response regulator [Lachnospiraceae bacterium]
MNSRIKKIQIFIITGFTIILAMGNIAYFLVRMGEGKTFTEVATVYKETIHMFLYMWITWILMVICQLKFSHTLAKAKNELEQARIEAEQANRAKTTFLFNMSHDIRTPISAIMGFADMLKKHKNDDKTDQYIENIQVSTKYLIELMDDVLEVSRLESGEVVYDDSTVINLDEFCDSVSVVFDESMKEKKLDFNVNFDVLHNEVYCDTAKLRRIYLNVLGNAVKYTPEGGSITMDISEIPGEEKGSNSYKTVISDTGLGISKEYLPHVFEEFTRQRTVTENKISGTGLGLYITKHLIELIGGTIEIESTEGEGTTVTFVLSLRTTGKRVPKNKNVGQETVKKDKVSMAGKRVLVAEDNELNAIIVKDVLEEAGVLTSHAEDGIQAVNLVKENPEGYFD